MDEISRSKALCAASPPDISDEDILDAMKRMQGYLDITPGDFKALYRQAYAHALERLSRRLTARDVMTAAVVAVRTATPAAEVARTMAEHGVSGVPVLDRGDRVAGVISEKDFLARLGSRRKASFMEVIFRCLTERGCVAVPMRRQNAGDIMTSPAVTVGPNDPVADIAGIFMRHGINRVPVTDERGKLIGIVARADIVQSSCMPPAAAAGR